jgi:hypothetical protein
MKPEIANSFGPAMQKEVSSLLENLGGMTEIIEANFLQIKDMLQSHREDIIKAITKEKEDVIKEKEDTIKVIIKDKEDSIKAITQEKNTEISDLKIKIEAKEVQIENLK